MKAPDASGQLNDRPPAAESPALFDAATVAATVGGTLLAGPGEVSFSGVASDSRLVAPGDLFVALPGERVDGHAFVGAARRAGASGAMISQGPHAWGGDAGMDAGTGGDGGAGAGDFALIQVVDTVAALGRLARAYRQRFDIPVIGVTGSVGKTTTRDLVAAVLGAGLPGLAAEGNYNTEIGLPLTLFRLRGWHRAAVLEMAMRGRGEIAYLCSLAQPKMGIITNIGETHLELLGSVENIAAAKAELLEALPADGLAILNGDDPRVRQVAGRSRAPVRFFGFAADCAVRAVEVTAAGPEGSVFEAVVDGERATFTVPLPGRHNVTNALAAIAAGRALGLSLAVIARGLGEAGQTRTGRRLAVLTVGRTTIIDDTYNASPASMRAALDVLDEMAGGRRRVAILADMLELGPYSEEGHREVGRHAAAQGLDRLVTVGARARDIAAAAVAAGLPAESVRSYEKKDEALADVLSWLRPGDVVLVKGSRGLAMETVVAGLAEALRGDVERPGWGGDARD